MGVVIIAACLHLLVIVHTLQEGERGLCVTFRDGVVFVFALALRVAGCSTTRPLPAVACYQIVDTVAL